MYKTYEFTFADMPASIFGMFVCDIGSKNHGDNEFGNRANIVETRIANRITPLHYGVRYNDSPLRFTLIFGGEAPMDRYQMQEVANWLTGYQEYQWLSIDQPDMENIQFRCLIETLTPISVRRLPVAFEAKIVCDCPYGYGYPFTERFECEDETAVRIYNDSTIRENIHPDLKIELGEDCRDFSITNKTTGSSMVFSDLPAGGITILVDSENQIVQDADGVYNLYDYFNFQFFELASGDNNVVFEGAGNVTMNGRCLYNVGA